MPPLHLALQSGSDAVLGRMHRLYTLPQPTIALVAHKLMKTINLRSKMQLVPKMGLGSFGHFLFKLTAASA